MTVNLNNSLYSAIGIKPREQLDGARVVEPFSRDRQGKANDVKRGDAAVVRPNPLQDDLPEQGSSKRPVPDEASTAEHRNTEEDTFSSSVSLIYQQARLIGAALRGEESLVAPNRGDATNDYFNVGERSREDAGSTRSATLHPEGIMSYSGKVAQFIYRDIGGVFASPATGAAQLVGVDERV